jgi:hyperosmotically inducible protein
MTKHRPAIKLLTLSALALSLGLAAPAFAETTGQLIDDVTITAKVKEAILADPQLKVMEVKVDTIKGVVTLSGGVDTRTQEADAVIVAKQIEGVKMVTDNMSIKSAQSQ